MDLMKFNNVSDNSSSSKSSATSVQSDGGNNSSCSNRHSASTNTGESVKGSSPLATSPPACLAGAANAILFSSNGSSCNIGSDPSASYLSGRSRPLCELDSSRGCGRELDGHESLLLKFPRLRDAASPHSSTLEKQGLFHVDGGFNSSSASHHSLSSYLSGSNHSSNHGSPTSTYAGTSNACSLFDGVSSHSRVYPYAILQEEPIRHPSSSILSVVPAQQASVLSSAGRAPHPNLSRLMNPEPPASFFTQEQLLEFTRQTFVFKHFVAGVTPPPSLLLPIISSVVNMSRFGAGQVLFGGNAGLLGVGGLRGNIDPEPGRCRRTDGKKWRCAREAVPDQKYCEKHMHRGRHRARASSKPVIGSLDTPQTLKNPPPNCAANATDSQARSMISTPVTAPFASSAPTKEPQLLFSLQPASMAAVQINRSSSGSGNCSTSSKIAAPPDHPPNLAGLLKENACDKATNIANLALPSTATDSPFSFACQPTNRDTDNTSLSQIVDNNPWSRCNRAADHAPSGLSWFEQLPEEQNKRGSFSTELSIATLKSPLANLPAKFVGNPPDDLVSSVEASDFMGLGIGKAEEDRYNGRSTWLPTAWDGPSIGGPLGEALQSSAAGGKFGGSFANNGGGRCLNLIENENWMHQEPVRMGGTAKDHHSLNVASPTGILQMKASFVSYSDSSSGASSPRSALRLDSSANLGFL